MPTVAESSINRAHELHSVSIAFTRPTESQDKREESVSKVPVSRILLMSFCSNSLLTNPPTPFPLQLMDEFSSGAGAFFYLDILPFSLALCGVVSFQVDCCCLILNNVTGFVSL